MKGSEGREERNAGCLRAVRAVLHSAAALHRHLHQVSVLAAPLRRVCCPDGNKSHTSPCDKSEARECRAASESESYEGSSLGDRIEKMFTMFGS